MARSVLTVNSAVLNIADTQAGLATGPDFACQVSSAAINVVPNTQTVPATGCAPESTVPVASGWELVLTWLQDWDVASGLSEYAFAHDTEPVWFSLTPNGLTAPVATGQAYVVAGSFLGDFGTVLTATGTWPCLDKPDITAATVVAAKATASSVA